MWQSYVPTLALLVSTDLGQPITAVGQLYFAFVGTSIVSSLALALHLRHFSPYTVRARSRAGHFTSHHIAAHIVAHISRLTSHIWLVHCPYAHPPRQLLCSGYALRGLSGALHALGCLFVTGYSFPLLVVWRVGRNNGFW